MTVPARRTPRSRLVTPSPLAANGAALMANVLVQGVGGFLFWIVVARVAPTSAVAEASAMTAAMLGVTQLMQQMLIANVPVMITASPRPGWILAQAYAVSTVLILLGTVAYVVVAPRYASGLTYLAEPGIATLFVVGSVLWGIFALQDAALSGILRGSLVLIENSVWSVLRLALVLILPFVVGTFSATWIVATWILPAVALTIAVNHFLYSRPSSPMRVPRGNHVNPIRTLIRHLGFEQLTAISSGVVTITLPAVALTAVGSDAAAPLLAAYSFIVVTEGALSSFASAYAIEIRRAGRLDRQHTMLTAGVLASCSFGAIAATSVAARPFMGLLGPEYRGPGGTALAILALGLPFRSITLFSGAINRVAGDGWRNALQQLAYMGVTFGVMGLVDISGTDRLASALVLGRVASSIVAAGHLRRLTRRQSFTLPVQAAYDAGE